MVTPHINDTKLFIDIILTTLKPQLKNVTAADVASSLYYFHLNTEDDARFLEEDPAKVEETTTSSQKPLPRKPLPESARSSLDLNRQMTSVSLTLESNSGVPKRKPVTSDVPTSKQQLGQGKQNVSRRPLGPRPLLSEPISKIEALPGVENRLLTATSQSQQHAPALMTIGDTAWSSLSKDSARSNSGVENDPANAFSITLIRRDPSSGAQWNIGHVCGRPFSDETSNRRTKKRYFDISIHLSTPGYNAFRNLIPTGHPRLNTTGVSMSSVDDINADQARTPSTPDSGFDRQVRMEGSSFWSRPSLQHKKALSDLSGMPNTSHSRSSSGISDVALAEAFLNNDGTWESNDTQSKGYMFTSPWGGRCKFSTGGGGRSLLCKHTLPAPVSASNTTDSTPSLKSSAPVSELRFNLPSSAVFSSSTTDTTSKRRSLDSGRSTTSKLSNLRKKLSPHKTQPPLPPRPHPTSYAAMYPSDEEEGPPLPLRTHRVSNSSEEESPPPLPTRLHPFPYTMNASHEEPIEDDPHLDLSIGQEKAGGGNRGKRAKLGKLVIHHEGFKMLDLVVAANISVWWSVWESVTR